MGPCLTNEHQQNRLLGMSSYQNDITSQMGRIQALHIGVSVPTQDTKLPMSFVFACGKRSQSYYQRRRCHEVPQVSP